MLSEGRSDTIIMVLLPPDRERQHNRVGETSVASGELREQTLGDVHWEGERYQNKIQY